MILSVLEGCCDSQDVNVHFVYCVLNFTNILFNIRSLTFALLICNSCIEDWNLC